MIQTLITDFTRISDLMLPERRGLGGGGAAESSGVRAEGQRPRAGQAGSPRRRPHTVPEGGCEGVSPRSRAGTRVAGTHAISTS